MATPLKHGLGAAAIDRLADNIARAWPAFDTPGFRAAANTGLTDLELKERVAHVAEALHTFLPAKYREAVEVILSAGGSWDRGDTEDPLSGFAAWPLFHFIEVYGADDFKTSMKALRATTHLFTGEFAIRPLLARYPEKTFAELKRWTRDKSQHVRRLASEGCRPRLPWATRIPALIEDPTPVLDILDQLKDDSVLSVRRSVANNLNDIAKDHPDRVIDVCLNWLDGASPDRLWVIRHATRSLVKTGHPGVWELLGFTKDPQITVSALKLDPTGSIPIESGLTFSFEIVSTGKSEQRLVIDYAVHFVKANGRTRAKVFKLKVVNLAPGAGIELSRRQVFRQLSTRKLYSGTHSIEILVNGLGMTRTEFDLVT